MSGHTAIRRAADGSQNPRLSAPLRAAPSQVCRNALCSARAIWSYYPRGSLRARIALGLVRGALAGALLLRDMVSHMKTTIEIADALMAEARQAAEQGGTTLRALVEEGLRKLLAERERQRAQPFRLSSCRPRDQFGGPLADPRGAPERRQLELDGFERCDAQPHITLVSADLAPPARFRVRVDFQGLGDGDFRSRVLRAKRDPSEPTASSPARATAPRAPAPDLP
jgi:Arc/MetJ family transcription regulator